MKNATGNLVIKKTRVKSKNPKYLNEVRYFGGYIDLGAFGEFEHWVWEKDAKLLPLSEAEKLFFSFTNNNKHGNYVYELIVN
jgi:hypothetical protein